MIDNEDTPTMPRPTLPKEDDNSATIQVPPIPPEPTEQNNGTVPTEPISETTEQATSETTTEDTEQATTPTEQNTNPASSEQADVLPSPPCCISICSSSNTGITICKR